MWVGYADLLESLGRDASVTVVGYSQGGIPALACGLAFGHAPWLRAVHVCHHPLSSRLGWGPRARNLLYLQLHGPCRLCLLDGKPGTEPGGKCKLRGGGAGMELTNCGKNYAKCAVEADFEAIRLPALLDMLVEEHFAKHLPTVEAGTKSGGHRVRFWGTSWEGDTTTNAK